MKWNLLEKLGGSAEGVIGTISPVTRECTLRRKDSEREGQVTTWLRHKHDNTYLYLNLYNLNKSFPRGQISLNVFEYTNYSERF